MSEHIPGFSSTYSKTLFLTHPGYPQYIANGHDACVHDGEGHYWTDWWSGLGAISLGYRHKKVTDAIISQAYGGIAFSLPHRLEGETAELLCEMAGTDMVRFTKNGGDATEAAVRLARHLTGRDDIMTTGYHGPHSDLVTATPGKGGGVLPTTAECVVPVASPEDVFACLRSRGEDVACLLAEPICADGTIWPWAEIKDACHEVGALLIFDEVITGFRYCRGPALFHHQILAEDGKHFRPQAVPDLYCFGKAIANGMPLACVAGPRELMREYEKNVFFSSTAAAECLSLAACKATLEVMHGEPVHAHIWKMGQRFIEGIRELTLFRHDEKLTIAGLPPRTQLRFPQEHFRDRFLTGMALRGHLLGRDNFITYSHTKSDVDSLLSAAVEVLSGM